MGFGITELVIVLVIVILLFGTKKLRSLGGDLGGALKSFRGAMKDVDEIEDAEKMDNKQDILTTVSPPPSTVVTSGPSELRSVMALPRKLIVSK